MEETTNNENKVPTREPIIAGILAFLSVGLGHGYNGQRKRGYLFFSSYLLLIVIYLLALKFFNEPLPGSKEEVPLTSPSYWTTVICWFVIWGYNIYDAYQSAKKINRGEIIVDSTPGKSALIYLRNIIIAFLVFIFVVVPALAVSLAFLGVKIKKDGPAETRDQTYNRSRFRVNGISYSKDNPTVIINGRAHNINDKIGTGTIVGITPEKIVVRYLFGDREYRTGSVIDY